MSKPKIRFKGYEEDWEQRKLKETIEYIVDNRGKNPDYYCSEGIPVIDNFMIRNSLYPDLNTATRFIDENLYQNFIRKYNEEDDILLTLVGNGIGNITLFPKDKAVIIQNTLGFRAKEDKKFLFFLLMANNEALVKLDRGMAQPSIRQDEILDLDIYVPSNSEQTQIGEYFTYLDNLITLHQRKCEETKKLKKYMLQKMFPQNGKRVPEIRFVGFTEDWEQRKLGDVLEEFSNKSTVEDEYTVLSSTNTGMEFRDGRVSGTSNLGYKIIEIDDLVLSPQNLWLGNININNLEKGLVSPSYKTFKLRNIDKEFFRPQLRTKKMLELYKQASVQGASVVRRNLDMDLFEQIELNIPMIEEQAKIGEYFFNLDYLITLHQRKYEELQKIKKFMLQNMFI